MPVSAGDHNLVFNGDFSKGMEGWRKATGISVTSADGNSWLVISVPGQCSDQSIALAPEWSKLRLTAKMRVTDVRLGDQGWKDARLAMCFKDKKGKRIGQWPNVIHAKGTADWKMVARDFDVPRGADFLALSPANFGGSGMAEFDDIRFEVIGKRSLTPVDAALPTGAKTDLWSLADAWSAMSATKETLCLNGLWAFRPLAKTDGKNLVAPGQGWGWFKVPGIWPGATSWRLGPSAQNVILSPWLTGMVEFANLERAWYKREITVPPNWRGRRVKVEFTMLSTHASLLVDGQAAGELWWPGGCVDITDQVKFGQKQTLAILVTARPLDKESQSFNAPDRVTKEKANVPLRGITGDVFLLAEPDRDAVGDVHLICSTRQDTITFDVGIKDPTRKTYALGVKILQAGHVVKSFSTSELGVAQVLDGRVAFTGSWPDAQEWDTDATENMYSAVVTLHEPGGKVLDESLPTRFGFREFWIEGRDFYLNGRRIHFRAMNIENPNQHADGASKASAIRTCRRMLEYGFNFAISDNYNFQPGAVGYVDGLLEAADETGMLIGFSLPHVKDFNAKLDDPVQAKRYRELTEWIVRRVQNHPSIVAYSMNHNATGYHGDQNPLKMDGVYNYDKSDTPGAPTAYSTKMRAQANRAAKIARSIDPTRAIYHHQSGNLGDMHTVNIYLNWAPAQERSDWLEHWSTSGVKPMFFVEWGLPHISSFSSHRGPGFIWRSPAFQQIWDSEFAAAFFGEEAYLMNPVKVKSMLHEEALWAKGKPFPWSTLIGPIRTMEQNWLQTMALFASENWRCHRAWNISAMLPWDRGNFWARTSQTKDRDNPGKYENLKHPGIVPDVIHPGRSYPYEPDASSYEPTSIGRAWARWNMPLCAFIGGGPTAFTDKAHNFLPGETVEKQLVIINDKRRHVTCQYSWRLTPGSASGVGRITIQPGGQAFVPIRIPLSSSLKAGDYVIDADFDFDGEKQTDAFTINVLSSPKHLRLGSRIALLDPKGMTATLLDSLKVRYTPIEAEADLANYDLLVIGREALAGNLPAPRLERLRKGLKVLVFEQDAETLQDRLGFRINVHGLRKLFVRSPHPALNGLSEDNLNNWRGSSTLTSPYLENLAYIEPNYAKWFWCGFENTHVWRCGNRGNVASVLIEKPAVGNWLPILDGGFDLQYAPLLENVTDQGRIVFCQLDVCGREGQSPAARQICRNLLTYLDRVKTPARSASVLYDGATAGAKLLDALGVSYQNFAGQAGAGQVLVVASGAEHLNAVQAAAAAGASVLCLGLDDTELTAALGDAVKAKNALQVSAMVDDLSAPEFAGVSNAELHWRTRPNIAAIESVDSTSGPALKSIKLGKGRVILCQAAPWHFDYVKKPYLRTTYRRTVFLVSRLLANLGVNAGNPLPAMLGGMPQVSFMALDKGWVGLDDPDQNGRDKGWFQPRFDDSTWRPIQVPGAFDQLRPKLANYDGYFWYRLHFQLPANMPLGKLTLALGGIDDESWIWLNGAFLGEVTRKTHPKNFWNFPREYKLTPGMLKKEGENVLVVLANDTYLHGGIMGHPHLSRPGPWLKSYYVQPPEPVDDPYRYYRW
jgi:hypothetical protein